MKNKKLLKILSDLSIELEDIYRDGEKENMSWTHHISILGKIIEIKVTAAKDE